MTQTVHVITLSMPLGMGSVNCYLLESPQGVILVDTGSSNKRLELDQELERLGCRPENLKLILLTHGDFDHTGNAAYLSQKYGTRTAMHAADAAIVERGDMFIDRGKVNFLVRKLIPLMSGFGKAERFAPDILVDPDFDLAVYGLDARILHLPGHSKGSIGILTADGDLISGDLVENTKTPVLNSMLDELSSAQASLEALNKLEIKTVYPGHGEPFPFQQLN